MRYVMKLSEFLALSYKDRVNLLFTWDGDDYSERKSVLEEYQYDYKKIFNHYYGYFDYLPNAMIYKLIIHKIYMFNDLDKKDDFRAMFYETLK